MKEKEMEEEPSFAQNAKKSMVKRTRCFAQQPKRNIIFNFRAPLWGILFYAV